MNGKRKQTRSAVAIVLAIAGTQAVHGQRAPGGPAAPSPYDAFYTLGPDSLPRDGVSKGEVRGPFKLPSKVYEGVEHSFWVYVPAQYDGSRDVSLMVFNDGATYLKADGFYRAQNVLDNLIYRGDIPVMMGAFIDPGVFVADGKSNRQPGLQNLTGSRSPRVRGVEFRRHCSVYGSLGAPGSVPQSAHRDRHVRRSQRWVCVSGESSGE